MEDQDIAHELPDGRGGIEYKDFLLLIPTWPNWLKVGGHEKSGGPEQKTVFPTRYNNRRYAITMPLEGGGLIAHGGLIWWAITDGLFGFTWSQLMVQPLAGGENVAELVRWMRQVLPTVLEKSDLSKIEPDGGISKSDREFEGARLKWKAYQPWDDEWDHDHCGYCWATFSLEDPGAERAGYALQGDHRGDDYKWICRKCIDERRPYMTFIFEDEP
jgi:hypothetical protein